jgi:hypothetical protein
MVTFLFNLLVFDFELDIRAEWGFGSWDERERKKISQTNPLI